MARVGLGLADLEAQIAHPFGEALILTILPAGALNLAFDLIEQRHEFAAQRLPFAGGLAVVAGIDLRKSAGHKFFPST